MRRSALPWMHSPTTARTASNRCFTTGYATGAIRLPVRRRRRTSSTSRPHPRHSVKHVLTQECQALPAQDTFGTTFGTFLRDIWAAESGSYPSRRRFAPPLRVSSLRCGPRRVIGSVPARSLLSEQGCERPAANTVDPDVTLARRADGSSRHRRGDGPGQGLTSTTWSITPQLPICASSRKALNGPTNSCCSTCCSATSSSAT